MPNETPGSCRARAGNVCRARAGNVRGARAPPIIAASNHAPGSLHTRRARAQSQGHRRRPAAQPADRRHRPVGIGQVVARFRHDLRRGPAALRRKPVGLCPPVPRTDGEARRRFDRGPVARHRDRPEDHLAQPALHRGHRHRDLRLHAPFVGAGRGPLLAGNRTAHRKPVGRADGGRHRRHGRGNPALPAGARRARAQGRVPQGDRRPDEARLPAPQGRRRDRGDRRGSRARPQAQARHRGRRRPSGGARRARQPAARFDRNRARPVGWPADRRGRAQRRAHHLLGAIRLPGVGVRDRRDRAAPVFVQQSERRLPGLHGPRRPRPLRPPRSWCPTSASPLRAARCGRGPARARPITARPWRAWPGTIG